MYCTAYDWSQIMSTNLSPWFSTSYLTINQLKYVLWIVPHHILIHSVKGLCHFKILFNLTFCCKNQNNYFFFLEQIYVDIINIKNVDMVRSIGEESSSGKDILDNQKVKIRHQKWDRRTSVSKSFMKIPLTGPEKSICSRWEKQYSVSAVEARSRWLRRYKILSPVDKSFSGVDTGERFYAVIFKKSVGLYLSF